MRMHRRDAEFPAVRGPARIVVLSDTHLPRKAADLPGELWQQVEGADVVLHAGDWTDVTLVDRLTERSRVLIGVWGNNDGPEIRARLPEVARVVVGGARLVMTHETGAAKGRDIRMRRRFPDADVLVFGHSHIPWDTTTDGGLRLLNPGSPTDRRRQPHGTFITATAADGGLHDVRFHAVTPARVGRSGT